jgi:hypothetical protein
MELKELPGALGNPRVLAYIKNPFNGIERTVEEPQIPNLNQKNPFNGIERGTQTLGNHAQSVPESIQWN